MKTVLIFDTETTGFVNFKEDFDHSSQPAMVELAYMLVEFYEGGGHEIMRATAELIDPSPAIIPPEAIKVHGITLELAQIFGQVPGAVLKEFLEVVDMADALCGHNVRFDLMVVKAALSQTGDDSSAIQGVLDPIPALCTMKASTPYVNIPGRRGPKWPKLPEALSFYGLSDRLTGAHRAAADVYATYCLLCELLNRGHIKLPRDD